MDAGRGKDVDDQGRKDALARTDEAGQALEIEPESRLRNEPESPSPANDDAVPPPCPPSRNEPGEPTPARVAALRAAILAEHAACQALPERDPEVMAGLVRELGDAWGTVATQAG